MPPCSRVRDRAHTRHTAAAAHRTHASARALAARPCARSHGTARGGSLTSPRAPTAEHEEEAEAAHERLDAKVYIERLKEQRGFGVRACRGEGAGRAGRCACARTVRNVSREAAV